MISGKGRKEAREARQDKSSLQKAGKDIHESYDQTA